MSFLPGFVVFKSEYTRLCERNRNTFTLNRYYIYPCSCFHFIVNEILQSKTKHCRKFWQRWRLGVAGISQLKNPDIWDKKFLPPESLPVTNCWPKSLRTLRRRLPQSHPRDIRIFVSRWSPGERLCDNRMEVPGFLAQNNRLLYKTAIKKDILFEFPQSLSRWPTADKKAWWLWDRDWIAPGQPRHLFISIFCTRQLIKPNFWTNMWGYFCKSPTNLHNPLPPYTVLIWSALFMITSPIDAFQALSTLVEVVRMITSMMKVPAVQCFVI